MKKTALMAALASLLGFAAVGYAADDDRLVFPGCDRCDSKDIAYEGEKHRGWCKNASDFCGAAMMCDSASAEETERIQALKAALKTMNGGPLVVHENKAIALEIANINPWAAESFAFIYSTGHEGRGFIENSEFVGMDFLDPASFTPDSAKKSIAFYHSKQELSPEEFASLRKEGTEKIRTVHEVSKTADGGAWLNLRISTVDADFKETGRILPNVRIKLRRVGSETDGYWEPVGWEY